VNVQVQTVQHIEADGEYSEGDVMLTVVAYVCRVRCLGEPPQNSLQYLEFRSSISLPLSRSFHSLSLYLHYSRLYFSITSFFSPVDQSRITIPELLLARGNFISPSKPRRSVRNRN